MKAHNSKRGVADSDCRRSELRVTFALTPTIRSADSSASWRKRRVWLLADAREFDFVENARECCTRNANELSAAAAAHANSERRKSLEVDRRPAPQSRSDETDLATIPNDVLPPPLGADVEPTPHAPHARPIQRPHATNGAPPPLPQLARPKRKTTRDRWITGRRSNVLLGLRSRSSVERAIRNAAPWYSLNASLDHLLLEDSPLSGAVNPAVAAFCTSRPPGVHPWAVTHGSSRPLPRYLAASSSARTQQAVRGSHAVRRRADGRIYIIELEPFCSTKIAPLTQNSADSTRPETGVPFARRLQKSAGNIPRCASHLTPPTHQTLPSPPAHRCTSESRPSCTR